ncbi:MAG: NAD-dependent epimerase/dehydratase family protein [Candidatus Nomurabacteria bacterium]|nr:NAD-dependent epimerase/dehydratase family protein [Candidatus Nomurabacteria bacterium]
MKKDKIIVIGGNGFIGGYLVKELKRQGKNVYIFDKNSKNTLELEISGSSFVAYLASPDQNLLKNTLKVISKEKNITFLYTSTLLLYKEKKEAIKEDHKLSPATLYAKNKLKEEELIINFKKKYPKVNIIIARLANVYGDPKNKGFIGIVLEKILTKDNKKTFIINGDGTQIRDYIFVDDVAKILARLLFSNLKFNIINVSTGIGTTLIQLIQYIEKITHKKLTYNFGSKIPEAYSLIGDKTKLSKFFKLTEQTPLLKGLLKTYKRYIIKLSSNK